MSRFTSRVANRSRAFTALAALGAITTATLLAPAIASAAQPAGGVWHTTVSYSYSELASDQGTKALYRRIKKAAQLVCPMYDARDLAAYSESRECQKAAVAKAVHQIGNARLAALHTRTVTRTG
ncbi:MAG TPA: UrcA family protein [Steroidobacteraceae bacterium]|nr:UrcA family protein [Steroidobacteraceae bacterium]